MTDDNRLKITLEDLEPQEKPVEPETASGAEAAAAKARAQAEKVGRQVTDGVKSTAQKATQKVTGKAAEVTSRSAEAVRDKMTETVEAQARATVEAIEQRVREVDWKGEAQKGATGGLKWLSERMADLAERITPADPPAGRKVEPPEKDTPNS
jgi:hypothetical protein